MVHAKQVLVQELVQAQVRAQVQALAVQLVLVQVQLQQALVVDVLAHVPMCNSTICGHS
jgi:hypothetical protein